MKHLLHLFLITFCVCLSSSIHGMKRNELDITIIKEAPRFPKEIIAQIAGYCQPKEKNILMRLRKDFYIALKNRVLILQQNLSTVHMKDKKEDIFMFAYANNIEMMRALLEDLKRHCVNVNHTNILGMTLLDIASNNKNKEAIQFLRDSGAHWSGLKPKVHPLHEAAYKRDVESVKSFLMAGVDPDLPVGTKRSRMICGSYYESEEIDIICTPLYIAAYRGYAEIAGLLLNAGANANLVCRDKTCLYIALERGHQHMVKLLLDKGAYANKKSHGITPLGVAVAKDDSEMVQLLLDKGANVYQGTGDEYVLPKELAKRYEYYHIVELFDHQEASNPSSFFCWYFSVMFFLATGICVFGY